MPKNLTKALRLVLNTGVSLAAIHSWQMTRDSQIAEDRIQQMSDKFTEINKLLDQSNDYRTSALRTIMSSRRARLADLETKANELQRMSAAIPVKSESDKSYFSEEKNKIISERFKADKDALDSVARVVSIDDKTSPSLDDKTSASPSLDDKTSASPSLDDKDSLSSKQPVSEVVGKQPVIESSKAKGKDIELPNDDIRESNVLGVFQDIYNSYKESMSHLNGEDLACLFNVTGFVFIFILTGSITSVYFGDKLITWLNLEVRFPKLVKYIKLRRQFQTYYLILSLILIYIVIFVFIGVDVYMILSH